MFIIVIFHLGQSKTFWQFSLYNYIFLFRIHIIVFISGTFVISLTFEVPHIEMDISIILFVQKYFWTEIKLKTQTLIV